MVIQLESLQFHPLSLTRIVCIQLSFRELAFISPIHIISKALDIAFETFGPTLEAF